MTHDYKEGRYSTGTLLDRLKDMCRDGAILWGRDVWPDDVLEAIERIETLEKQVQELTDAMLAAREEKK